MIGPSVSNLLMGTAAATALLVPLALAAPAHAATGRIFGITESNTLIQFQRDDPGTLERGQVVSGLSASSEQILGLDIRPADQRLYAVTSLSRIYTIDPATAVATFVSTMSVPLEGTEIGVDFNPVVDRLRVVSNTDQNLRVDVDTGQTTVDGELAYASADANAGDNPSIGAAGYTNNVDGATSTTLYDIDTFANNLVIQDPPNAGTLNTVGALGTNPNQRFIGLDIADDGQALAALLPTSTSAASELFRVDLQTGTATRIGAIADSETDRVRDLAQEPTATPAPVIPEVPAALLLPLGALGTVAAVASVRRRRLSPA